MRERGRMEGRTGWVERLTKTEAALWARFSTGKSTASACIIGRTEANIRGR